jgi:DNA integrity scanning protein DisA with diadenylate cyclase activity
MAEESDASGRSITGTMLEHLGSIAGSCGATAVFVYVDELNGNPLPVRSPSEPTLYYVTKASDESAFGGPEIPGARFLRIPNVPLTRLGQVKIALFLAFSKGLVKRGDKIVFLCGVEESGNLDTIIVTEVGREYEIFATSENEATNGTATRIPSEVVDRVIEIASELGSEGREGKPVGALFVVGDTEKVLPLTRQLILNPFRGYPEEKRNLLDHSLEETIKELSAIDGAFIIRRDGVIESCGTYLKTASQEEFELPQGLGARHHAAAAITSVTDSIAVTVSESTGTVTIFRKGAIVTEIEKPRSIGRHAKLAAQRRLKSRRRTNSSAPKTDDSTRV